MAQAVAGDATRGHLARADPPLGPVHRPVGARRVGGGAPRHAVWDEREVRALPCPVYGRQRRGEGRGCARSRRGWRCRRRCPGRRTVQRVRGGVQPSSAGSAEWARRRSAAPGDGDAQDQGITDRGVDTGDVGQVAAAGALFAVIVPTRQRVGIAARALAALPTVIAVLLAVAACAAVERRAVGHDDGALREEAHGQRGLQADTAQPAVDGGRTSPLGMGQGKLRNDLDLEPRMVTLLYRPGTNRCNALPGRGLRRRGSKRPSPSGGRVEHMGRELAYARGRVHRTAAKLAGKAPGAVARFRSHSHAVSGSVNSCGATQRP
jgi:hypothetical protein